MSRAEEFIRSYNEIADHMRRTTGLGADVPFSMLVSRAAEKSAAIRMHAEQLKDYADLRNAIVHHRTYPGEIIAEPSEEVMIRFRGIVQSALSPKLLIPTFQRKIRQFAPNEPLVEALKHMKDNDYSQIILRTENGLSILSVEGIAQWLEQRANEDLVSLAEAKVGDAHPCEPSGSCRLMGRNLSIYDAREAFVRAVAKKQPRLFAVIITQTGKHTEEPLGVATPWDFLDGTHA